MQRIKIVFDNQWFGDPVTCGQIFNTQSKMGRILKIYRGKSNYIKFKLYMSLKRFIEV